MAAVPSVALVEALARVRRRMWLVAYRMTGSRNLFALFDRLFSTFTPAERGVAIAYGLDGFDHPAAHTAMGLLGMPFRRPATASGHAGQLAPEPRGAHGSPLAG